MFVCLFVFFLWIGGQLVVVLVSYVGSFSLRFKDIWFNDSLFKDSLL